jgi:hypothetical protein
MVQLVFVSVNAASMCAAMFVLVLMVERTAACAGVPAAPSST